MRFFQYFIVVLFLSGCHFGNHHKTVELVYGDWPIDVATANLAKVIIEKKLGINVNLLLTNSAGTWAAISTGTSDISLSAWLPSTHKYYYKNTKERIDLISPIYKGVRIGLAVPTYVTINSIDELKKFSFKFKNEIMGIDPGAGIMVETEKAIKSYNLTNMKLIDISETVMLNMLKEAYQNKEWIVITAWNPHDIFLKFKMKFLKDPKGIYGEDEEIYAISRLGFKEDYPEVYQFLKNFKLSEKVLQKLLLKNKENNKPYDNALEWALNHPEMIKNWLEN